MSDWTSPRFIFGLLFSLLWQPDDELHDLPPATSLKNENAASLITDVSFTLPKYQSTIGGDTLEKSWSVLRDGGRIATLVEFGIASRNGRHGDSVFFASATPSLSDAATRFRAGQLQIVTDSIFSLDEARGALEKLATGHARGKVLIRTRN